MTKVKVRFYGQSHPINGRPSDWDYVKDFDTHEEAAEAITDYMCSYDDPDSSIAHHETYYEIL